MRQCSPAEWEWNFYKLNYLPGCMLNVFCASRLACVPCTVQVTSQTSSGLHSQSSQKLGKNWLSLKYKQMELFSCTSKSAFELFMYTPFIVQNIYGWVILESPTDVSVTGHPLHMDSGSLVSWGCVYTVLLRFRQHPKTRKHPFHVMLFVVGWTVVSVLTQPDCIS